MKMLQASIGDILHRRFTGTLWLVVSKQKKLDYSSKQIKTICGFLELSSYRIFYGDLEVDDSVEIICRIK